MGVRDRCKREERKRGWGDGREDRRSGKRGGGTEKKRSGVGDDMIWKEGRGKGREKIGEMSGARRKSTRDLRKDLIC